MSYTVKSVKLPDKSSYRNEYDHATCKGDKAIIVYGKMEKSDILELKWDDIDKSSLPFRGGTIANDVHTFRICVSYSWWDSKKYKKLFDYLKSGDSIEEENTSIYFWKVK